MSLTENEKDCISVILGLTSSVLAFFVPFASLYFYEFVLM